MNAAPGGRLRLAFISTLFLLPPDAGGKIRSGNVLRGLKGGAFDVTLLMPATPAQLAHHADDMPALCDRVLPWTPQPVLPRWTRAVDLLRAVPANVAFDDRAVARRAVARALAAGHYDVVVYDFVHAAVLRPAGVRVACDVCFTHNVEAEILERHAQKTEGAVMRAVWASQAAKMRRFEGESLRGFDRVIAVAERDAREFERAYNIAGTDVIPTGVDLDFFAYQAPADPGAAHPPTAVFTASMDSAANIDAVRFFLTEVWPRVLQRRPDARFKIVGRNPPPALVREGQLLAGVEFKGYVDDVRPHVRDAQVFVMPLRVGGGTRLKAFEGMAMGCPVVSTSVGIEGLDVTPGEHYERADEPPAIADALLRLFDNLGHRQALAERARRLVETRFGFRVAAEAFERACLDAHGQWRAQRHAVSTDRAVPSGASGQALQTGPCGEPGRS